MPPAEWRKRKGWTQEQHADVADLTLPTLRKIERGDARVTMRSIRKAAEAVEAPLTEYVEGWESVGSGS